MSTETTEPAANTSSDETPGDDEQYCPECGEIILRKADVCPECGVSTTSSESSSMGLGGGGYLLGGGLISPFAVFFPLIAIVPIYCGIRIYHEYSTKWGIAMGIWGGLTFILSAAYWFSILT